MSLHETFTTTLTKAGNDKAVELISALLAKKFEKQGLKVGKKQVKEIATQLANGSKNVSFGKSSSKDTKITITETEGKRVSAQFDKWIEKLGRKLPKIYEKIAEETTEHIVKILMRRQKAHLDALNSGRQKFEKQLNSIWKKPFDLFEVYVSSVEEIGIECNNEAIERNQADSVVFDTLFRLIGRGVQIAKEVLVLMKSGFADGAHARWRSLHEIAIVAMFIDKYGQDVAERYLAHEAIDFYRGAELHQQHARVLRRKVIPKREMARYKKSIEMMLSQSMVGTFTRVIMGGHPPH